MHALQPKLTPVRLSDSSAQWQRFGEVDPYYGVLSSEEYRRENLTDEKLEQFFASGESYAEWLFQLLGDLHPRTSLDFGCGVGRVLVALAGRCAEVTGVDVSQAMLAECRSVCEQRGIWNVRLTDRLPDERFDLVHCTIVLQHAQREEGYRLIGELAQRVADGGVGALHVALRPSTRRARVYFWATARVPYAANAWNLVRRRPWSYPHMRMTAYSLDHVLERLAAQGVSEAKTVYHPASAPMGFHSATVFFKRPAQPPGD
jgi:ubiquinone/menaquinone biosynthesis C-methylase UbiE